MTSSSVLLEIDRRMEAKGIAPMPDPFLEFIDHQVPTMRRCYVGHLTVTDCTRARTVRRWVTAQAMPWTPPQWAREWLDFCLEQAYPTKTRGRRRTYYARDQLAHFEHPAPLLCVRHTSGTLAVVDIDSCYHQLYAPLSLDIDYRPDGKDTRIGSGRVRLWGATEITSKDVRRSAWGISRRRDSASGELRRGVPVAGKPVPNRFMAPGMWGVMCDTLHAIATVAVERFGCHEWATDGGVFPAERAWDFIDWLWEDWGITASIRAQGPGWVRGANRWKVGGTSTLGTKPLPCRSNLRPLDAHVVARLIQIRLDIDAP